MKKENKILVTLLGIGMILFGVFFLSRPLTTLLTIISYIAWAVMVRGVFFLYNSYKTYRSTQKLNKIELIYGIILVVLGIIFLANPVFTSTLVFYLVAFWFIFDGIIGIFFAVKQKKVMKWVGIALGSLLVFFGLSIALEPLRALFTLNILVGLAVVTNGIQLIESQFIKP